MATLIVVGLALAAIVGFIGSETLEQFGRFMLQAALVICVCALFLPAVTRRRKR